MTEIVFYKIYFVVTPQLALSVEFLFEILYVGAPPIIEKCLLHGHFHSVNYYQYNIVEPKTLIYYVLGSIPSFNDSIIIAILYCPMISVLLMRHSNYKV
ncbi:hypothetical protein M6KS0560p2_0702 [Staphylococcus aureus]|nr:Uncharacterised protein [Staphylococcus aureus]SBB20402.1 Uncharacterised protein [Staphylococcus aureus]SBE20666.1 Uncharacterised protein [Staphylococcus aureus]SBE69581.1 Uncharacterised protein [Staphylococcus aureus]SCR59246.1 Uncharacterised protein [Staphylococcus aureus]